VVTSCLGLMSVSEYFGVGPFIEWPLLAARNDEMDLQSVA
jgi:hypothetical protein